jgi:glycosyltransferase involved in cell wall biosynthesis
VITIERDMENSTTHKDDVAARGLNPFTHLSYLRTLETFAKQWASSYDLVLEKGWRLSGCLLAAFRCQGVPGVLVENDVRYWSEPIRNPRTAVRYLLHEAAQFLAGFYTRRVPLIIAETEELRAMLVKQWGIPPNRLEVIGLGVDHRLFHPMEQNAARKSLGLNPATTLLLYVGGMDIYHDLDPVAEALARIKLPSLELHLVGDGERRLHYEEKARHVQIPMRFHGRVPHWMVPRYIAAADLCIAPYRADVFHDGLVPFSTLKIPEYMACGRPVVSIPNGYIQRLVEDQISGFLFQNDVSSWTAFLQALPSRNQLRDMGQVAARAVESLSWEGTAARYLEVCRRLTV